MNTLLQLLVIHLIATPLWFITRRVYLSSIRLNSVGNPGFVGYVSYILIGIMCIMVVAGTSQAEKSLEPLMKQFKTTALAGHAHQYAREDHGSTLDYGGSLDDILQTRNATTRAAGLFGFFVRWETDGSDVSYQGVYVNLVPFMVVLAMYAFVTGLWMSANRRSPLPEMQTKY